ncbi:hypothetical protein PENPOL_c035G03094 [Penicillium polonicum]|uniref:Uncharacterized protein n=1 Tax=Penicillium polonicum TaxID=60169 RepID=A0A1V6N5N2_PENPO|nr:hypothetical protein PENPOL_c035G03094 [Penicillium polonicum]
MGATSLSVIARKAAEQVVAQLGGDEGGWWASNRSNETSLSVNMRKAARRVGSGLGTSLSVNVRKAAERVVAQLGGDEGGWWASPPKIALIKRLCLSVKRLFGWWVSSPRIEMTDRNVSVCEYAEGSRAFARSNVSVCEHVEGSRTYGGFIFLYFKGGLANVSVCERAEGSRACGGFIFLISGEGWRTSLSVNVRKAAGRVVARLFGEGMPSGV